MSAFVGGMGGAGRGVGRRKKRLTDGARSSVRDRGEKREKRGKGRQTGPAERIWARGELGKEKEEDDRETSFRVIGMMHYYTKFEVLLFDSGPGSWSVCASTSWDALSLSRELAKGFPLLSLPPSYAYGSLYWKVNDMNRLLKLDISKIEFSIIDLPLGHDQRGVVIVEAGEDGSRTFATVVL
ncbi:hypothetical protein EJB05_11924, partial [Eragrostis curvula]